MNARFGLFAAAAFVATAFACAEQPEGIRLLDDASATRASAKINVALGNVPSKTNENAFRIHLYSDLKLDPASVKLCFAALDKCTAPTLAADTMVVATTAKDYDGGRKIFTSDNPVQLSANLPFVIIAKDATGAPVAQAAIILTKGAQPPGPAPAPAPAPPPAPAPAPSIFPPAGPVTPPAVSPSPQPPAAGDCIEAPSVDVCNVEKEIVRLTNEKRASSGMQPLQFHAKMGYVARLWSDDQAARGNIGHEWFSNGTWAQKYQQKFNEQSPAFAENVAMNGGVTGLQAAAALVEQWWNSPGHKANMLGNYGSIGVGVTFQGGSVYATQNFGR